MSGVTRKRSKSVVVRICARIACTNTRTRSKMRKRMTRPTLRDTMLAVAAAMAERSTCSRRHNGAVIATRAGVILSTGYNGSLSGMPHCIHPDTTQLHQHTGNCRCIKPKLASEQGCTTAVHAEANAIYHAARHGIRTELSIMYCTTEPCRTCAEAIVQAGIKQCIYTQEYRTREGRDLLLEAGISIVMHTPGY